MLAKGSARGAAATPEYRSSHLVERHAVLAPIVELGGAGGGMRRHLARLLESSAVLEVGRDPRASKRVVANVRVESRCLGAPLHHPPCVPTVEAFAIELRDATAEGLTFDRLEQRQLALAAQFCAMYSAR